MLPTLVVCDVVVSGPSGQAEPLGSPLASVVNRKQDINIQDGGEEDNMQNFNVHFYITMS